MPKFEPIQDVIRDLCLRSGDTQQRNKGLYLNCARDMWNDLNEDVLKITQRVKIPVRHIFKVNKKTNSIDLDCSCLRLSSVNVIDHHGYFHPVWKNDSIHDDIVDVADIKNCACEFNCGYQLCNTIKGYEAIISTKSDKLPNGSPISFTCVDRKYVDAQGFFWQQTQYPIRVYTSGTWTDTVLKTENIKLCAVDVDSNGCVCDSDHNLHTLCAAAPPSPIPIGGDAQSFHNNQNINQWKYFGASQMEFFGNQCGGRINHFKNIYNLNELGNKIVFPHDFAFDHVMVRCYADISLKNLMIPYIAKECAMTGIQWFSISHRDDMQQLAAVYEQKYTRQKWGLLQTLNKYRIVELNMITATPVFVPSYLDHRHDKIGF